MEALKHEFEQNNRKSQIFVPCFSATVIEIDLDRRQQLTMYSQGYTRREMKETNEYQIHFAGV